MESVITNEQLTQAQQKITAALQVKVLSAINHNTPFRNELEAIRFSVEITERLTSTRESGEYPVQCGRY
jgi:hypothetical protein